MATKRRINRGARRAALGLLGLAAAGLLVSCNSHPVSFSQSEGAIAVTQDRSPDAAAMVDILWMIDNSGSMCQEQEAIRENFMLFIEDIVDKNIDFQMGITTTHMVQSSNDQLARPGYLQAIPQPVNSTAEGCGGTPEDEYRPVRVNIEQAIQCTKEPEKWAHLRDVTPEEIGCALAPPSSRGEHCDPDVRLHELFPTTPDGGRVGYATPEEDNPYRSLPGDGSKVVLRSSDYRDEQGRLSEEALEELKADFACMSLVGTQGDGFEKGLASVVHAVSPEMTGGTVENPLPGGESAPNHGLIRDNANFALVFVTDENDCSDYGLFAGDGAVPDSTPFTDESGNPITRAVNHRTPCQDTVCSIYNSPDFPNTPLIGTEELADRMLENLSATKGEDVNRDGVVVTSIHGEYSRYGESYPTDTELEDALDAAHEDDRDTIRENYDKILANPNECELPTGLEGHYEPLAERITCATEELGTAYSGDRYERFLRHFHPDRVLPALPSSENVHMPGLICNDDGMGETLREIGQLIGGTTDLCIQEPPFACESSEECPSFTFGDDTPSCRPFGRSDLNYCDSGLEIRMYLSDEGSKTMEDLRNHPYCIPESVDSEFTSGGCIIDRSRYDVVPCASQDSAINIEWVEEAAHNQLAGYSVRLVYALLPEADEN